LHLFNLMRLLCVFKKIEIIFYDDFHVNKSRGITFFTWYKKKIVTFDFTILCYIFMSKTQSAPKGARNSFACDWDWTRMYNVFQNVMSSILCTPLSWNKFLIIEYIFVILGKYLCFHFQPIYVPGSKKYKYWKIFRKLEKYR
jgi:hypothetical protein